MVTAAVPTTPSDVAEMVAGPLATPVTSPVGDTVAIGPERYNDLYEKFGNLNSLLGWGHARVIENLLARKPDCPRALSDKFADASVIEKAVSQWGQPNGYILGQEAAGAFVAGLRYGEGTLYTRNAGDRRVFWQGPSIGFDWGGEGARTMILVYQLPSTDAVYQRFAGIDGSAYFVGGFGMTALGAGNIVLVPIRSGVGLRLGANIGYLHFTREPTWNPF